ncbi:MAG: sulfotransferase family protein [Planctomycetes bacterium]|nr:sulfotransferase family protein [Planctomycetota bacterium]
MVKLYFIHIPKTAGNSTISEMQRSFGAGQYKRFDPWVGSESRALMAATIDNYGFVSSHAPFAEVHDLVKDRTVFTFLRHPVDRVTSLYNFYRSFVTDTTVDDILVKHKLARTLSLKDFARCTHPAIAFEPNNGMSRVLCRKQRYGKNLSISDLSEEAMSVIETIEFGLLERFRDSLGYLEQQLGLYPSFSDPWENKTVVSGNTSTTVNEATDAIIESNEADLRLYNHAKKLFIKRLSISLVDRFIRRRGISSLPAFAKTGSSIAKYSWSVSDKTLAENLYFLEKLGQDGSEYRFTGPGTRATLYFKFPEDIKCAGLRVYVLPFIDGDFRSSRIFIADREKATKFIEDELTREIFFEVSVTQEDIRQDGLLEVCLDTVFVLKPRYIDSASLDDRSLGVAITRVELVELVADS